MQLATWKASEFSFGLSSQPCWEKVKQQWVNHGFCVSGCSRWVLGLGSRSAVVCACGLSSITGALLGWDLALAEVSLLPSWRCEGFPTAGQMGHLLPWHREVSTWSSPDAGKAPAASPAPPAPLGQQPHASAPTWFVFFQLPPSETSVLGFAPTLPFLIANFGWKEVNEGRHEQICEGKNMLLF